MKAGRVLIIVGWVMVAMQLLAHMGKQDPPPAEVNSTAYYIGYNLFGITGIILLIIGYRKKAKAKARKEKNDLLDNFLRDSPENRGS